MLTHKLTLSLSALLLLGLGAAIAAPQFDFDLGGGGSKPHIVEKITSERFDSRKPDAAYHREVIKDNHRKPIGEKKERQSESIWDSMPEFPSLNLVKLRKRQDVEISSFDDSDFYLDLEDQTFDVFDSEGLELDEFDEDDDEGLSFVKRDLDLDEPEFSHRVAFDNTNKIAYKLTDFDDSTLREKSVDLDRDHDRDFDFDFDRRLRKDRKQRNRKHE